MKALEIIKENEWALLAIGYYSPRRIPEGVKFKINSRLHDGWVLATNYGEIQLLSHDGKILAKHDVDKNSFIETLLKMVNRPSFPVDKIKVIVK
ncbi:MAG: hypothetical protein K6E35_08510 [Bacteroidales bacterium]|nr:hypothetical protein [Bacteroidales bacterium]